MVLRRPGLITWATRSPASHIGILVWRNADQNTLAVSESREGRGGQTLSFSSQVRRFPGQIDIYRPTRDCPEIIRERAATICFNWAGYGYNYPGIKNLTIDHMPVVRFFLERTGLYTPDRLDLTPTTWEASKFCSQLYAWAYRRAKYELGISCRWDPVPGIGDRWITPAALIHSGSFNRFAIGFIP